MTRTHTAPRLLVLAAAALLALSGCAASPEVPAETAVATPAADSLAIQDAWVKAAETGMSAAFGTLENSSDTDITVVSADSEAATMIELHETVEDDAGAMVMQQKEGGFVVPANGSYELAPGANHMMLMGLTAALPAGTESTFTLTLSDGSEFEFAAPAKDYAGANESYEGDMDADQ
ncbi:copper chaperone PCu(A)C [Cryobacterium melibiosiphilum]|uniref:Copper chaperone PCu(A)C n=1 Tax=Cryobacterium melibiosiphilum TaxID=995039 RepID=A0A3A5MAB3_9MICO|nr:copper chaperone PCu(A)C [Cryobacterium melibiosiphilum]RJT87067.1 copper chaperone PCu(A)C [Cryobacterium melibiosiphilum]